MAKIRYSWIENNKVGTHSVYARPVYAGTLTMDELLEEALNGKSIEPPVAKAAITFFMEAVQRNVKRGYRCQLGENFLTVYPNISLSVKDRTDKQTGELIVATPEMLNAANGRSRLGCTVSPKFSAEFASAVQWQKVDKTGAVADEDDITQGNENVEGEGTSQGSGTSEGSGSSEGSGTGEGSGTTGDGDNTQTGGDGTGEGGNGSGDGEGHFGD